MLPKPRLKQQLIKLKTPWEVTSTEEASGKRLPVSKNAAQALDPTMSLLRSPRHGGATEYSQGQTCRILIPNGRKTQVSRDRVTHPPDA